MENTAIRIIRSRDQRSARKTEGGGTSPTADILRKFFMVAVAGLGLWLLGDVLLLVFGAILLAVVLRGMSDQLARYTGGSPMSSLFVVTGLLVAILGTIAAVSGPQLADQGNQLWDQLLAISGEGRHWLEKYSWGRTMLGHVLSMQGAPDGQEIATMLGSVLTHVLSVLASFVIVVAAGIYFAAAPQVYRNGVLKLLPPQRRERALEVMIDAGCAMRNWMKGQALSMLVLAATTYIGLTILDIPLAPLLAIIAGLCNFVPYVGPFAGALPSVLVAFGAGPDKALWVVGMFTVVEMIEGNVIAPLIQKRTSDLAPAATILSQTLLGALFGIPGVMLATPILAASLVVVKRVYVEDVLGDKPEEGTRVTQGA